MPASINDHFNKVISGTTRPVATTLSAQKINGATTASLTAATGWDTGTALHGIMYRTDAGTGEKVPGSQIDWKATLSGTTLSDFTVTAGTDDTYAIGTTVELAPTAAWGDDMATGLVAEHNQDGTHSAVTADSLTVDGAATHSSTLTQTGVATFATHIDINDSSTAIRDSSDNELLKFAKTASAVNEIEITNAATGGIPQIAATGGDANISLYAKAKGTGHFLPGNPVAFLARRTTDQSGIATGTTTKVQFATETFDLGGNFDNATNYNFVAPYDGIYHFSWSTCMDSIGTIYYSMLYINGSLYTSEFRFSNAATDDLSSGGSCTVQMTAGQTADVRVQHNAGANRSLLGTTSGANYFSGYLVGRT